MIKKLLNKLCSQFSPENRWSLVVICIGFILFLAFGVHHLGKFQTADEDLWFANPTEGRIHEYWRALLYHNWEETRINDKPGATTALVSGSVGLIVDKKEPGAKMIRNRSIVDQWNPPVFETRSFFYRLPIVITNGILILFIAWFVWRFTENSIIAATSAGFLFLSPILIGMSQIVNPDATLWSFGFAALMGLLTFFKTTDWKILALSTVFMGAALASKYAATFLYFFGFFALYSYLFFTIATFKNTKEFARHTLKILIGGLLFLSGSLLVFGLIMPAAFVEPKYFYEATLGFKRASNVNGILILVGGVYAMSIIDVVFVRGRIMYNLMKFLQSLKLPLAVIASWTVLIAGVFTLYNWGLGNVHGFTVLPFDTGTGKEFRRIDELNQFVLNIRPIVFTITPIVLVLSFLALFRAGIKLKGTLLFFTFIFASYIALYFYVISEQNIMVHVRYSILIYPALSVLAGLGFWVIYKKIPSHTWKYGLVGIVFLFSGASVFADSPYYFNYTNSFLPKNQDVVGAWGYGGYESAQFLNKKPGAKDLIVWADYEGFCPFFVGHCIKGSVVKWYKDGEFTNIDYYVTSRRGLIRNQSSFEKINAWGRIEPYPVFRLYIGNRTGNFVEVYKAKDEFGSKKSAE